MIYKKTHYYFETFVIILYYIILYYIIFREWASKKVIQEVLNFEDENRIFHLPRVTNTVPNIAMGIGSWIAWNKSN